MTQITLANSDAGTIDFAGSPPSSLLVATSPGGLSGAAFFSGDTGAYSLGDITGFPSTSPLVGGNFAAAIDQAFGYSAPDGDALSGLVHWSLIKDHSANPDLIGELSIAASTGDAAFVDAFPTGGTAHIDLVLAFVHPSPFLDVIAGTTDATWTMISAGEIVPQGSVVTEPGTLIILAVALIAAWFGRKIAGDPGRETI